MNNTLLILGNGFDLSFGLRTAYGDFMQSQYFKEFAKSTYLGQYLKNVQGQCNSWIDIEKVLSQYCLEINGGGVMTPMKQYGPNLLSIEYESLKQALKCYLREEQRNMQHFNIDANVKKLIRNINYGDNNKIATFNYTDTVKHMADLTLIDYNENNLLHVHGSLAENEDIVFGVEDAVELPKKHAFLYKAYSKYKRTNLFALWLSMARNIVFYGYSLGDTDKQYFVDFFRNLCHVGKDNRKIIFYHYGEQGYLDLKWQLMNFTNKQLSALEMCNDIQYRDCSKEDCNFNF